MKQRKRLFILAVMGDPKSTCFQNSIRTRQGGGRPAITDIKMANSNANDRGSDNRIISCQAKKNEKTTWSKNRQRMRSEPCNCNTYVANTSSKRSETGLSGQDERKKGESEKPNNNSDRWPARPGENQYNWEAKRAVKPGLGSTAHGYNFREDLLRAYGNGVVEQTAKKAWIELWKKHAKQYEIRK